VWGVIDRWQWDVPKAPPYVPLPHRSPLTASSLPTQTVGRIEATAGGRWLSLAQQPTSSTVAPLAGCRDHRPYHKHTTDRGPPADPSCLPTATATPASGGVAVAAAPKELVAWGPWRLGPVPNPLLPGEEGGARLHFRAAGAVFCPCPQAHAHHTPRCGRLCSGRTL